MAERSYADPAVAIARDQEDVVVGDEVVRHRLLSRALHWSVAFSFVLALFTGLPIWTAVFGWLAPLFGGLQVCGWLHPWFGAAFFGFSLLMFGHWAKAMKLERGESAWLGKKMLQYLRYQTDDDDAGKYNGGQKLFFYVTALGALGLFASGFVLWWPQFFPIALRQGAWLLHDFTFICFVVAVVLHMYLGTAAEPGTFRAMTKGTVSRAWARFHHPRWFREITQSGDVKR